MQDLPRYYDCEICGGIHPWDWDGDCRDNATRFSPEQLDALHPGGYDLETMEERVAEDNGAIRWP